MQTCVKRLHFILFILFSILTGHLRSQSLPEGFQVETVISDVEYPAGMVHSTEVSYVWELNGLVWAVVDGEKASDPLIDIRDEVGFWNDHGLLSAVLHPDFEENGFIYLLYVVDRYHLYNASSPDYDPELDKYEEATIGRVVRYSVDTNNPEVLLSSDREVIIGATPETGIPIPTISHGLGTLLFGADGSLLVSVGDGNAPGSDYNGTGELPSFGYDDQALADGILSEGENVGAFRAQYLNSYCGKILRINPETGMGYPSNPFYDPNRPDQPISKVWALGFRNPFRMSLIPETGSDNPENGEPGTIVIGDVGDWTWEEINIVSDLGQNFGWPIFQGPEPYYLFINNFTPDYESPLEIECDGLSYFRFQDLIVQPTASHNEIWPHPCEGNIQDEVRKFVHSRPSVAYANNIIAGGEFAPEDSTVLPGFDEDGLAIMIGVTDEDSGIEGGEDFTGISSVAGVFYQGESFPEEFRDLYLQADFSGWFRAFEFDQEFRLIGMQNWSESIGSVVHISENPNDGSIYLASLFPGEIKRLSFAGNLAPVIEVAEDTLYGPAPLTVSLDASSSYDPEGEDLTFEWNLDDGSPDQSGSEITHTFSSPNGLPLSYRVNLTAADPEGNTRQKVILVSLNNTPPEAEISGFADDYLYSIEGPSTLELTGKVFDSESSLAELDVKWDMYLHHNTHFHLERSFNSLDQEVVIQPLGCGIETFWYRFDLTVTDPQGLTTKRSKEIFPNCEGSGFSDDPLIYPNPTDEHFVIEYPSEPTTNVVTLKIYDTHGRLLREDSHSPDLGEISKLYATQGLLPGTYVVELNGGSWKEVEKLVVVPLP